MAKVFISPAKYVQGPGELDNVGAYAEKLGKKALCVISEGGRKRVGEKITSSFAKSEAECTFELFNGECCDKEITRLLGIVSSKGYDLVVGVGGGKIFDTAKAVAYKAGTPVVICPTIASTDAPCSALSVIYTEDGVFQEYLFLPANPNVVLVDTEIIAKSPVRLSVSGMGDAMATYWEAKACADSGAGTCAGGTI
ncbi:MAG: iron-containing alcohol dehydrogenase, partial [Lachnospiraceae bacterium]|nr:iron-containing alcohol dehydrogenase [Lachnospiraceae bacterium]